MYVCYVRVFRHVCYVSILCMYMMDVCYACMSVLNVWHVCMLRTSVCYF